MRTKKKINQPQPAAAGGFTLIEVLIVLAIGSLIMLVVFIAVPAVQRQQRNQARKQDAARIAVAMAEYISNNRGILPGTTASGQNNQAGWVISCQAIARSVGRLAQIGDNTGDLTPWCNAANMNQAASFESFVNDYTYYGPVSSSANNSNWLVYTVFATCPASVSSVVSAVPGNRKQSILLYPIESGLLGNQDIIACIQVS